MNTDEIISYDLSLSPNTKQIQRMLDRAFEKFSEISGLIFNMNVKFFLLLFDINDV